MHFWNAQTRDCSVFVITRVHCIMPWSHLHIQACPVRATLDNFHKMDWDVAISWQLQSLCGCYGVYVSLSKFALLGSYGMVLRVEVTTALVKKLKPDIRDDRSLRHGD